MIDLLTRQSVGKSSLVDHLPILGPAMRKPVQYVAMMGELAVVLIMLMGGDLIIPGFYLSLLLLSGFTLAIYWIRKNGMVVDCGCFGHRKWKSNQYDIIRNLIFMTLTVIFIADSPGVYQHPEVANLAQLGMLVITAISLVLLIVHFRDIVESIGGGTK
ncbi:MAG: hypothetical protein EPO32_01460 [Anaerolineae bacterium]|nr:MAG: hypothetical protein EPO32_01460 [Anaerolineae bacterium]